MRLVKAIFRGGNGDTVYTVEQQTDLMAAFVALDDHELAFDEEGKVKSWYQSKLWDLDLFPLEFISDLDSITPIKLGAKLSEVFTARSTTVYNEHVKVVMPGIGMLQFDHVTAVYNLCTDELRSYLKLGWRIIAVCPQPDQRRPDYVLGRVGPEE